jgi:hypothetical protein
MPALPSPTVARTRARYAALIRHRPPDDPAVTAAARDHRAEVLAEHVRRIVDTFPPLTAAQRDRIAALLASGPGDAA